MIFLHECAHCAAATTRFAISDDLPVQKVALRLQCKSLHHSLHYDMSKRLLTARSIARQGMTCR
eukprot:1142751-Pelagomonas_calceolata.AAC.1